MLAAGTTFHHAAAVSASPAVLRCRSLSLYPAAAGSQTPLLCPQKIRAVYDSNPAKFKTLQNILEAEKEMHGSAWPKTGATLALMWLKR